MYTCRSITSSLAPTPAFPIEKKHGRCWRWVYVLYFLGTLFHRNRQKLVYEILFSQSGIWGLFPDLLNLVFNFANAWPSTREIHETKSTANHKMYKVYIEQCLIRRQLRLCIATMLHNYTCKVCSLVSTCVNSPFANHEAYHVVLPTW